MGTSVLLHVLWLQLMILLTVASFPGEEEAERLGETVTQVEFIGEGTPQEELDAAVLAVAYLMNYSGATVTLGLAFAATGALAASLLGAENEQKSPRLR